MICDENQWYCTCESNWCRTNTNDIACTQRCNYQMAIHIRLLITCKGIVLIFICIQVYGFCTDRIYPCYVDRWFSMMNILMKGQKGVEQWSVRSRFRVDQESTWGWSWVEYGSIGGGAFYIFVWPSGVILYMFTWFELVYFLNIDLCICWFYCTNIYPPVWPYCTHAAPSPTGEWIHIFVQWNI